MILNDLVELIQKLVVFLRVFNVNKIHSFVNLKRSVSLKTALNRNKLDKSTSVAAQKKSSFIFVLVNQLHDKQAFL